MSSLSGTAADAKEAKSKEKAVELVPSAQTMLDGLWASVTLDQLDSVFPAGLSNAVSYWIRLGAPFGLNELVDRLKEGKAFNEHRKKGWHAGMCVAIHLRVSKGGAKLTEKEIPMWNNYAGVVPDLAALIFDGTTKRTAVTVAKLEGREVQVPNPLLDAKTRKWLITAWPAK